MTKRKREHKWIKTGIFLALVVAAGVVCYLVWDGYFRDDKREEASAGVISGETKTEKLEESKNPEAVEEALGDSEEKPAGEEKQSDTPESETEKSQKISQYDGEDANKSAELTGAITYAGEADGTVSVWVNIDQFVTEGSCKLRVLKSGEAVYEDTVALIADITTSTCEGFSFAREKLKDGAYEIAIDLSSGNKKGTLKGELSL